MTKDYYYITGNQRFFIERSKDFDNGGRMIDGSGWFLNAVQGNSLSGLGWFPSTTAAENHADKVADPTKFC